MCYVNMERRVIPHSVGKCHAVTKGLGTCQVRRSLQIVHSLIHNKKCQRAKADYAKRTE